MKNKKQVSLFEGVLVALICSLTGSVLYFTFTSLFSVDFTVKLLMTGLSFFYLLYLLSRSHEAIGRLSVVLVWFVITIALWFFSAPVLLFVSTQLVIIWLVRSIYFYSSLFSAAADLALSALSMATAMWTISHTASPFLTLWCFFLTQALFVLIPRSINSAINNTANQQHSETSFQHSYRVAEAAVMKLSSHQ